AALEQARNEALAHTSGAPAPALLKAIADAHAVGVTTRAIIEVLDATKPRGQASQARAIEVLADLEQRHFPEQAAAHTVALVAARDPALLGQLASRAEALVSQESITRVEALDVLGRASTAGLGLSGAGTLLHHGTSLGDDDRGPNRETSGSRGPRGRTN